MSGGFSVSPDQLKAAKAQVDEASSTIRITGIGISGVGGAKAGTARAQTTIEREQKRLSEVFRMLATQMDGIAETLDMNSDAYAYADEKARAQSQVIRDVLG